LVIVGYDLSIYGSSFTVFTRMYQWNSDEESITLPYRVEVWQTVPVAVTFGSAFLVSCFSKYIVQLKRVTSRS